VSDCRDEEIHMKKLTVRIHAELEIPNDWEIVELESGV